MRLCPHLVVVPPQMFKYRAASKVMRRVFAEFTDMIEPLSLDEAYLDVTEITHPQLTATQIAKTIRERVYTELSITVSAGVSVMGFAPVRISENGICTTCAGALVNLVWSCTSELGGATNARCNPVGSESRSALSRLSQRM
jgi:hypothetical protein